MPAVVRTFSLADAPPSTAETAVERIRAFAPHWSPDIAIACIACGSTSITFESAEYETGVGGEVANDAGYRCHKCGAFEQDCDEHVAMPAAALLELAAAVELAAAERRAA